MFKIFEPKVESKVEPKVIEIKPLPTKVFSEDSSTTNIAPIIKSPIIESTKVIKSPIIEIGQSATSGFVKLSDFGARPYPSTTVSLLKYDKENIKHGKVIKDYTAKEGAHNIMVQYDDGRTETFTDADDEKVMIKINSASYSRGGKKSRKSRKFKKKSVRKRY
jgi:hypothetical protein